MKADVTKIHLGILVYGLIFFLSRVPGLLALGPESNGAEDQNSVLDSQTEAIATARKYNRCRDYADTRKVAESRASEKTAPFLDWAQVGGRWWFLGDDSELRTITCDARPSSFLRSFIPKWLRKFDTLQLDTERLLWLFCANETTINDNVMDYQIPHHICGLPVVVMLPTTPCQILEQPVLDEIRIDPACALKSGDLDSLWDAFPFATGLCIWMSGHIQLLAPHLSNAEIAALGIPSRAAGLKVSISRWSPEPTAEDSDPSSQQSQSDASLNSDQSSRMLLKRQGANGRQHSQRSARLGDTARTNGMDGHGPQHNSAPILRSSVSRTPTPLWPSIDQTIPALRSSVLRQATPGPAFSLPTFTSDLDAVPAHEAGRSLDINSRLKIGNRISTAGVKVKMSSGPFVGRAFLSASTHAVFEGKTGKRLRTRSPYKKRKKRKNIFARIFRSAPTPEAITLAEVEVRDLYGNTIGKTVDSMIYDSHPIPSDAIFPDAFSHDLCFVGPLPEPSIRFKQRTSELSWYQGSHLPIGCGVAILDDPGNSEGRSFRSGVYVQKPIKIRDGNRVVLLEKDVVDTTILFRRQAMPLGDNNMSGAAVVTKGDDHVWNKVVGFQSFQFVPPEAAFQVEQPWNEGFLDDIRREKMLACCICGARPVPEILKSQMEIINEQPLP